ncbi:MAG TPA: THUMP domain-containing protein [Burkholderiales bacterium]|nr:THUMP domain-containing protein [Burkholderiales bacterium]
MRSTSRFRFFATCPRGLEPVLEEELRALGAADVAATDGGVAFGGDLSTAYRVNYGSRVASRVLWQIARGGYRSEEDLYRAVNRLDWSRYFGVDRTLRVNVSAIRSPLKSLDFVTLRIKDAVCDRFRAEQGRRPSVDTAHPDVRIHAFLTDRDFTLYLDTSGEALFKRGYRVDAGEAPLRENLAAGILRLTGWKPEQPLLDPMCGAGTFLVEAAQMALGIPPGVRRSFGFERLKSFDAARWRAVKEAWTGAGVPEGLRLFGADRDAEMLERARRNLGEAGLGRAVRLIHADVLDVTPPPVPGVAVANPPYGVRMEEQDRLAAFYPRLGDALKRKFAGWRAYLFTADLRLPKLIGLSASRRVPLYNGPLECRLYEFKIVSGAMRREKKQDSGPRTED